MTEKEEILIDNSIQAALARLMITTQLENAAPEASADYVAKRVLAIVMAAMGESVKYMNPNADEEQQNELMGALVEDLVGLMSDALEIEVISMGQMPEERGLH